MSIRTRLLIASIATASALVLAACSPAPTSPVATPSIAAPASEAISLEDMWVKSAAEGMTPAFGTIYNSSSVDLTIVAVETEAARVAELHETVMDDHGQMIMRPIEGGFVIPANGEFVLSPAGNHLMLMDLVEGLEPGQSVVFTLQFDDGSEYNFAAVVKDYSGANETYVPDDEMDMDMDGDQP